MVLVVVVAVIDECFDSDSKKVLKSKCCLLVNL